MDIDIKKIIERNRNTNSQMILVKMNDKQKRNLVETSEHYSLTNSALIRYLIVKKSGNVFGDKQ